MQRHSGLSRNRPEPEEVARPETIPGKAFIRFRPDAVRESAVAPRPRRAGRTAPSALASAVSDPLDYLRRHAGLRDVRPLFSDAAASGARRPAASRAAQLTAVSSAVERAGEAELAGYSVLTLDPKGLSRKVMREVESSRAVEFMEPVPARWTAKAPATPKSDPEENLQWGLRAIRWYQASKPDARDVEVAVLDTGLDREHPDLKGVVAEYRHGAFAPDDVVGHGTHVAGILAAGTNNRIGITGVARCKLRCWKVFSDEPIDGEYYVDGEAFAQALAEVHASGARVLNLSLGGTLPSKTEESLIARLIRRGILVVAAMGNEHLRGNPIEYPAAYANVLAVGALGENWRRSPFSNTGKHIGICAPGANVLSTLPLEASAGREETEYAAWSGTSMAAPHVAGAAALVLAKHPDWDGNGVKAQLLETAVKLVAMDESPWTAEYGSGLLDLAKALK